MPERPGARSARSRAFLTSRSSRKLLASRLDTNVVYAAFNNMLRGDFKPYLLKSTDRGRTWTSIRGNLPDDEQIWTIAEDDVNRNLLFVGTERGVWVTLDGGQSWQRLHAGLPSVAVRDIQIQRRENDLVARAHSGAGIYIIDDYSPLRALAARQQPTQTARSCRRARHACTSKRRSNAPASAMDFSPARTRPSERCSAIPSRARRRQDRTIVLVIKDAAGKTINEVPGPGGAGLNRAVWNLRHAPDTTSARAEGGRGGAGAAGRGGRGGAGASAARDTTRGDEAAPQRGGGRGGPPAPGPLVTPGTYTVQLARRTGTTLVPIGTSQRLKVIPLER